jgi:hypothetical protein
VFVQNYSYCERLAVPRLFQPIVKQKTLSEYFNLPAPLTSALTFTATERGAFDRYTLHISSITEDRRTVPAFIIGIRERLQAKRSIVAAQQVRFAIVTINILFVQSLDRPSSPLNLLWTISMRTSS